MKRTMVRDIPEDIHRDFKVMCVQKGVSMNAELLRLIREAVEGYRKKEKK